jgi:hypothetical protein
VEGGGARLEDAERRIFDRGHVPFLDDPERCGALITALLAQRGP